MNDKERIEKIKANEKKIAELRVKRNETMRQILKLYEKERGNKECLK